ncbi:hypothetical protein [Sedimentitalea nanhaiensis]|uniref:HdeA/HdeB family protein n=1 Tax=Sedimentitalea nanhaiensis TaxID=999627 RepID=A0A1I7D2J5_9RHOB|nr:hypothetical protein [Sedimentitalea nanhaiensis]SFU05851.1 hypothetical protein SAMN05216236_12222 [Sedimentitalea nanhaiensis]
MYRIALAACLLATPVLSAETKEQSCGYQAQVMSAVQQARLDKVKEADVATTIAASNPVWPDNYSAAIPQLAQFVYSQKMRDLRKNDLGAVLREQCIENWDQIQKMQKDLKN